MIEKKENYPHAVIILSDVTEYEKENKKIIEEINRQLFLKKNEIADFDVEKYAVSFERKIVFEIDKIIKLEGMFTTNFFYQEKVLYTDPDFEINEIYVKDPTTGEMNDIGIVLSNIQKEAEKSKKEIKYSDNGINIIEDFRKFLKGDFIQYFNEWKKTKFNTYRFKKNGFIIEMIPFEDKNLVDDFLVTSEIDYSFLEKCKYKYSLEEIEEYEILENKSLNEIKKLIKEI